MQTVFWALACHELPPSLMFGLLGNARSGPFLSPSSVLHLCEGYGASDLVIRQLPRLTFVSISHKRWGNQCCRSHAKRVLKEIARKSRMIGKRRKRNGRRR